MQIGHGKQDDLNSLEPTRNSVVKTASYGDTEMGPGTFIIAILGCADGGSACTPVATLQTQYANEAQCVAATGAALIDNSNFDYPTLVARCRQSETNSGEAKEQHHDKRRRA